MRENKSLPNRFNATHNKNVDFPLNSTLSSNNFPYFLLIADEILNISNILFYFYHLFQ